jgi:hypothetical protein
VTQPERYYVYYRPGAGKRMRRIDARLTPLQTERLIESLSLQSYVSRIEDAAAVIAAAVIEHPPKAKAAAAS